MDVIGVIAILLYLAVAGGQAISLFQGHAHFRTWIIGGGLIAVALHAVVVYGQSISELAVNIGIYPMASLVSWAIAATVLLSSLRKPLENLLIVLMPLAALMIGISLLNPSNMMLTQLKGTIATHILLSVLAYSFLTIAAFHSLVVQYQHRLLKHSSQMAILRALPPMQTMESLLFELLWVGWAFLTLSIISGFIYLDNMFAQHIVHHTIITLAAWVVFAILLVGRVWLGWRGKKALRWTLAGFALLLLGYFGSKLVVEIILGRG